MSAAADASSGATAQEKPMGEEQSFIDAVASADVVELDVEGQQQQADGNDDQLDPPSASVEKPLPNNASTTSNVGILAGDDEDTASVFSFDSYEKQPRIPLRMQTKNRIAESDVEGGGTAVPFPSVMGASMDYERAVNVCPCRCLFFTLKEAICLVMSALGCAVFLSGLVVLCLYLEGSLFNNSGA